MKAEPISQALIMEDYYDALHHAYNSMRRVFRIREHSGTTQEGVADMLKVDKSLISRRIKGRENMTLRTLSSMATALSCKLVIDFKPHEDIERKNVLVSFSENKPEDMLRLMKIKHLSTQGLINKSKQARSDTYRNAREKTSFERLNKKPKIVNINENYST